MIDPLMFIALLPAVVLVVYICRKDRTDKEPPALIAKLLGYGVLSCLPAIVVELILSAIIERLNVRNVYLGYFLEAFVVAGLTEETCKFLFLRTTWRNPAFDYQFDAIVYAVMVALGFAAFENVKYVYSYGFAKDIYIFISLHFISDCRCDSFREKNFFHLIFPPLRYQCKRPVLLFPEPGTDSLLQISEQLLLHFWLPSRSPSADRHLPAS